MTSSDPRHVIMKLKEDGLGRMGLFSPLTVNLPCSLRKNNRIRMTLCARMMFIFQNSINEMRKGMREIGKTT